MSVLLGAMAGTLEDVAYQLRADKYPAGSRQQMMIYALALPSAVGDELGDAESQGLRRLLLRSYEVEQLFDELSSSEIAQENRDRELLKLDRAAGMLRAKADLVRV